MFRTSHGGIECSRYMRDNLIESIRSNFSKDEIFDSQSDIFDFCQEIINLSFVETDLAFYDEYKDTALNTGSACILVLIIADYVLCVNLGDSRAVLSQGGKAIDLSQDQKPNSFEEKKRIMEIGGNILGNRIDGTLAVSRAFGDFKHKVEN